MAQRTAAIIVLTAAICLAAPKERAWQDGRLLENRDNPYFNKKEIDDGSSNLLAGQVVNDSTVFQNSGSSTVVYDHYVIEGRSSAYLVEHGRVRSYPAAHVIVLRALKFAVAKNKLWFVDQDGQEIETKILKEVARPGARMVTQVQAPAPAPLPAVEPASAVVAQPQVQEPVVAQQEAVAVSQPAPRQEPLVATKQEPDAPPVVVKQAQKPEPPAARTPQPQMAAAPRDQAGGGLKDRPWQSGQLLSTVSNPYFANVAYTTDTEASSWTFVQGADGKATVFIRAGGQPSNPYIYDNFVIDTEFLSYLVQRPRLKTVPPIHLPGTKPLKFAIEKNKIWITDEEGKEYEAKIVKQVQKNSDPGATAGMRTAAR